MDLTFDSSVTATERQWCRDALARVRFDHATVAAYVTVRTVPEPPCPGHRDFMCTSEEADGTYTVHVRAGAEDPAAPFNAALPPNSVQAFFMEAFVHELGHVIALQRIATDELKTTVAGLFTRVGAAGDGFPTGKLADWNPLDRPWEDRIQEAVAEVFKDAVLPESQRVYENRTTWQIGLNGFQRLMDVLFPTTGVDPGPGMNYESYYGVPVSIPDDPVLERQFTARTDFAALSWTYFDFVAKPPPPPGYQTVDDSLYVQGQETPPPDLDFVYEWTRINPYDPPPEGWEVVGPVTCKVRIFMGMEAEAYGPWVADARNDPAGDQMPSLNASDFMLDYAGPFVIFDGQALNWRDSNLGNFRVRGLNPFGDPPYIYNTPCLAWEKELPSNPGSTTHTLTVPWRRWAGGGGTRRVKPATPGVVTNPDGSPSGYVDELYKPLTAFIWTGHIRPVPETKPPFPYVPPSIGLAGVGAGAMRFRTLRRA